MRRIAAVASVVALLGCQSGPSVEPAKPEFEACDDAEALAAYQHARALVGQRRFLPAVPLLRRVVEACPEFVPGHVLYQDAAMEVGVEIEASMRGYYSSLPDDGRSPIVPYVRSRLTEEPSEKIPELDEAIARDRSFHLAYLDKAIALRAIGRTSEALDMLQHAVAAQPTCAAANKELAEVLAGLGRAEEAASRYAAYLALEPNDLPAKRAYVRLLVYSLGRLDQAEPWLADMLANDPNDVEALMDRAAIAWQRRRFDEASDHYHRVLAIDPGNSRAVLNLGNLYFDGFGAAESARPEYWPKAQAAYRYFLTMTEARDLHDTLDLHVFVPSRLERIARDVGPAPDQKPRLEDF
ncbi:MAG: tetratricopeptide repeat protein [Planctomycetes bacterium]|nr:tetratricopeptide repeat protein [Planctomycetota bacterium]